MYYRKTILLSPVLATLALSAVFTPQAVAAPPQAAAITAVSPQVAEISAPVLLSQPPRGDYQRGFRDGYRQGHDDGLVDGRLDCRTRPQHHQNRQFSQNDYDRGFADGYPKGYESGYARFCGHRG